MILSTEKIKVRRCGNIGLRITKLIFLLTYLSLFGLTYGIVRRYYWDRLDDFSFRCLITLSTFLSCMMIWCHTVCVIRNPGYVVDTY